MGRNPQHRRASLQGEAEKNYAEAVELHGRLLAEEERRARARERMRDAVVPRESPRAPGGGTVVSTISHENEGEKP